MAAATLLVRRSLLVGVVHRRVGRGDYAQRHFVDLAGSRRHFADRGVDALHETVERGAEQTEFIVVLDSQAFGQVALTIGDIGHGAGHEMQRLDQDADQHAQQGDDDRDRNDGRNERRGAEFAELREGFVFIHRQTDVPVDGRQAFDGVKVTMRVLPSASTSLKSLLMRGVFFGYASVRDFITSALSGCARILPSALTRKA